MIATEARYANLYRATFDLADSRAVESEPVAVRLIVAVDFTAAVKLANAIRNKLRPGAVHKDCVVRDLALVYADVLVPNVLVQGDEAAKDEDAPC